MQERDKETDLTVLDDSQLTYFVQKGNEDAFNELTSRYISLIKSKAFDCRNLGIDYDDLFQEGLLGLLNAARTFEPLGKASFRTYAGLCIKRRMYTLFKSSARQKRIPSKNLVSLNENAEDLEVRLLNNPEEMFIKKEEDELRDVQIKKVLSDLELKVLYMYISGSSYSEISGKIGISFKSVDNALQRIKKKLREIK